MKMCERRYITQYVDSSIKIIKMHIKMAFDI